MQAAGTSSEHAPSFGEPSPSTFGAAHPIGRAARLALIAGVLGGMVFLEVPLCPFAIVTRHPCPGCGLTRATLALLHGHVADAYHLHPMVFVMAPLVGVGFLINAVSYLRHGRWSASEALSGRLVTAGAIALGVVMLTLWVARFFGAFGGPVPV
jgi:hypothetical protein